MISLIWAMDANRLIGKGNALPWRLPADMGWFKQQTMGKPILMGRKTYESIGKPLPGRLNLVLTRQDMSIDGCTVVHSLQEALQVVGDGCELMVIGGAEVYAKALPMASRLYVTEIEATFDGDAWFPVFDTAGWRETLCEDHAPDEKNLYSYRFRVMERQR